MAKTARKTATTAKTAKTTVKKAAAKTASTAKKTAPKAAPKTAPDLAAQIRAADPFSFQAEWSTDELIAAQQDAQKAFEALGRKTVEFTQANFEASSAAAQDLLGAKDVTSFVDAHTTHMGKAMERGAAQFLGLQALVLDAATAAGKPFGQTPFSAR